MKKTIKTLLITTLLTQGSLSFADSCMDLMVRKSKLEKVSVKVNDRIKAIELYEKLSEIQRWAFDTGVAVKIEDRVEVPLSELKNQLTIDELAIITLSEGLDDLSSAIESEIYTKITINVALSSTQLLIGNKIFKGLIEGNSRLPILKNLAAWINQPDRMDDRRKTTGKIRSLSNVSLLLVAPAYIGYQAYTLNKINNDLERKIEMLKKLHNDLMVKYSDFDKESIIEIDDEQISLLSAKEYINGEFEVLKEKEQELEFQGLDCSF